ncbi:bifunctional 2-C-methyl-D-erythritol 4-phosphate cytidylyltransferase/2-C-methyl-D-erythritol 2,4-cyclodiphosphate synthase [Falsigemmobacter faecalis]|uniref:Bifunctional enzyme IspD/IspF n=1 Tax=Falsigemmobacter faecalis TaxID=2488730 RepID=A0A3P3DNK4_9RHOB|nr:bifunctional 2-C-methyl-D-erythritol 4-phosphate cytidylyltransferase/2-C-methyl-D-erythritol 2,4-cyclodiphosphate synthase [Falsigemmobacter faecalis]RRH75827.1 bifunctional 2-C-methyl-D-erythritol 4-phosphate cytidylyltransferase/2-C-methyl-D-erythritol 2,4-cyclodiphosphate synthase [Falsigemmobacter faecalis]
MREAAIIVAAGRGSRMGGGIPKQWRDLAGQPVLAHAVDALRAAGLSRVVLVLHPEDLTRADIPPGCILVATTGPERADSVQAGLAALKGEAPETVYIHDGARPFPGAAMIDRLRQALLRGPGAAPALAVTDSLWRGRDGEVSGTERRDGLFRAQTPQAFRYEAICAAHAGHPGGATDDVQVARDAGLTIAIVDGDEDNLKLTWPEDFARARRILKGRDMDIRMGNGFDVHAFTEGDHVWLCGVRLPHDKALLGHSDADVGMHALTDAIYGALAEGDIGTHFPPSDPQWKGAESHIFLRHAMERVAARGYKLANCDVTLMCERPKIGPHQLAMRQALAAIMGVDVAQISVKATTTEKLGFTGREEGIASQATALLVRA